MIGYRVLDNFQQFFRSIHAADRQLVQQLHWEVVRISPVVGFGQDVSIYPSGLQIA
jgi:hypothetical protein